MSLKAFSDNNYSINDGRLKTRKTILTRHDVETSPVIQCISFVKAFGFNFLANWDTSCSADTLFWQSSLLWINFISETAILFAVGSGPWDTGKNQKRDVNYSASESQYVWQLQVVTVRPSSAVIRTISLPKHEDIAAIICTFVNSMNPLDGNLLQHTHTSIAVVLLLSLSYRIPTLLSCPSLNY